MINPIRIAFLHAVVPGMVLAFAPLTVSAAASPSGSGLPTHCMAGEFAYLNASMSAFHHFPTPKGGWKSSDTVYELRPTGKVLSICTDRASEPLGAVTYRFGPIGHVEMARTATASQRFQVFERSTSPHTGQKVLSFTVGPYTYCVTEATAQGRGIGLMVLKGGRKVLDFFSGTADGKDFESGLVEIWFSASRSPALQTLTSADPFDTRCDPKPH